MPFATRAALLVIAVWAGYPRAATPQPTPAEPAGRFVYIIHPTGSLAKYRVADGRLIRRGDLLRDLYRPGERGLVRYGEARQIDVLAGDAETATVFIAWAQSAPSDSSRDLAYDLIALSLRDPLREVARFTIPSRQNQPPDLVVAPRGRRLYALWQSPVGDSTRPTISALTIPALTETGRWVATGKPVPWTGDAAFPWRIASLSTLGPRIPASVRVSLGGDSLMFPAGHFVLERDSFTVTPNELTLRSADRAVVERAIPSSLRWTRMPVAVGHDGIYWKAFVWPDSAPRTPEVNFRTAGLSDSAVVRFVDPGGRSYAIDEGATLLVLVDDRRPRLGTDRIRTTGELRLYDGATGKLVSSAVFPGLRGRFDLTGLRCASADGRHLVFQGDQLRTILVSHAGARWLGARAIGSANLAHCLFARH